MIWTVLPHTSPGNYMIYIIPSAKVPAEEETRPQRHNVVLLTEVSAHIPKIQKYCSVINLLQAGEAQFQLGVEPA